MTSYGPAYDGNRCGHHHEPILQLGASGRTRSNSHSATIKVSPMKPQSFDRQVRCMGSIAPSVRPTGRLSSRRRTPVGPLMKSYRPPCDFRRRAVEGQDLPRREIPRADLRSGRGCHRRRADRYPPRKLAAVRREVAPGEVGSAWGPALDNVWHFIRSQSDLWTDGHNVFVYHHANEPYDWGTGGRRRRSSASWSAAPTRGSRVSTGSFTVRASAAANRSAMMTWNGRE